jgi:lipopolysaccharide export system protein LptA
MNTAFPNLIVERGKSLLVLVALVAGVGAAMLHAPLVFAEKADRAKPLNIEADKMQMDDLKQVSVFTGRVLLTKGTIIIRAERLVLKQDPEGYQFGTAYGSSGKVATFRQKREGVDQFVEGYGEELEYDGKNEIVRLKKSALLKRLEKEKIVDEVCGNLIVYESLTELFTAESGPAGTCNPSGRVKLVIQPRADDAAPAGTPAPKPVSPGPALKPSDRPNAVK